MSISEVILKARKSGAAIGRHPWVFGGMIEKLPKGIADGDQVSVRGGPDRRWIGYGLYNSRSEIQIRMYSYQESSPINFSFIESKIEEAYLLRKRVYISEQTNAYRVVHSDADGLSGLVVDLFKDTAVVQISSLGLMLRKDDVLTAIESLGFAKSIVFKMDRNIAELEGLSHKASSSTANENIEILENNIRFLVNPFEGQKTGFFSDQRENRKLVASMAAGKDFLDLCCYTGGFSLYAARAGARLVTAVDSSESAISLGQKNAEINELNIQFEHQDAVKFCQDRSANSFDMIVLDPPKLAPNRKSKEAALKKYYRFNLEAIRLLRPGGILATCSCSGSINWIDFERMLASATRRLGRDCKILFRRGAGPDHPVSIYSPQSDYLKVIIAQIH